MKIVVDTNVVETIGKKEIKAYATPEIIEEYEEIVEEMISRKQGNLRKDVLSLFTAKLNLIEAKTKVEVCRDPDDDKFISCALDAKALYIVSGDKDLLVIGQYEDVQIITAAVHHDPWWFFFCPEYGLFKTYSERALLLMRRSCMHSCWTGSLCP